MMQGIKQLHLTSSQQTVDSLKMSCDSQILQLAFYLRLIGENPETKILSHKYSWEDIGQDIDTLTPDDLRMLPHRKMEMDLASAASILNVVAAGIYGLVAPLCAIPQVKTIAAPMGVGASVSVRGSNFASALQSGSIAIKMGAMVVPDKGSLARRRAAMARRLQQRRLQANIRGREIKLINKQMELQQIHSLLCARLKFSKPSWRMRSRWRKLWVSLRCRP